MSDERDDGGPAFPSGEKLSIDAAGRRDDRVSVPLHAGMTLRDWFAGQALCGIIAAPGTQPDDSSRSGCAELAYEFADAMLKARNAK